MAESALEIRLGRVDRTYRPGDVISGVVVLVGPAAAFSHGGISLRATGAMKPHLDEDSGIGLFKAFGGSSSDGRSIELVDISIDLLPAGKLPAGMEVPFQFTLAPIRGRILTETYRGVYVSVRYHIEVAAARSGFFSRQTLEASAEVIVEVPSLDKLPPYPVDFEITPDVLENVKKASLAAIPRFVIRGRLHRTTCALNAPFSGEVTVVESAGRIRSIELQLVRVEIVVHEGGVAKEATEIQNLQVGEGDVARGLPLPLYMIFPRSFTCPSVLSEGFRVEFEANLIVVFDGGYTVTENFPLVLYRDPTRAGLGKL